MHEDLVFHWLRTSALLVQPILPHFSEFIWMDILGEKTSVQTALWPEIKGQADPSVLAQLAYMRGVLSSMRSAESTAIKKKNKGRTVDYDPAKPRSGRIYVATKIPVWQEKCLAVLKEVYEEGSGSVDDKLTRAKLQEAGMLKEKKAMPYIQAIKVSI